jgi:malonyl-CoA decarboxylase
MVSTPNTIAGFWSSVAHRGRSIIGISTADRHKMTGDGLILLCHKLLSSKGEASGIALSFEILNCYQLLDDQERLVFFQCLSSEFSASSTLVSDAAQNYLDFPTAQSLSRLSAIAEPPRQKLILRLNQAPDATLSLIKMRQDLLGLLPDHSELIEVDSDFKKLFTSWFNGGFLLLKRLDWSSSASILEKIIEYEAVHSMSGWDDLRARLDPADRHIYGFFHPRLEEEPLIFVEVALTKEKPSHIKSILDQERVIVDPADARTAVFYSISNCQQGLRGIPLGSFLIKQVVEDLRSSFPDLKDYVTLSPVPGFARWIDDLLNGAGNEHSLSEEMKVIFEDLKAKDLSVEDLSDPQLQNALHSAIAWYLVVQKNAHGQPQDPVARFHLGNGAQLERINWPADLSASGLKSSLGAMVNYAYRLEDIEKNHEAFVENGEISSSTPVTKLSRLFDNHVTLSQSKLSDLSAAPVTGQRVDQN